ncbi:MAG: GIY-YIG nuclease family protein, partial [Patescibacteria group bacterium]|nr:GIY-YIG nuclease family protein [Patescibacteria group bacterium]
MPKAYVYILKSEKNGRFYIGSTNNLLRRINEHFEGKAKYTRNNRPLKLVFSQEYENLKTARSIEKKLKKFANQNI